MIMTMTKEVKGKNNNGIYFCTYFSDGEQAVVNEWIEFAHGSLVFR
jgi:hypothetical protein